MWGRGARRTLEYSRWLSVSDMVPHRRDLNSQTALRVLALVLMCGHCKGAIIAEKERKLAAARESPQWIQAEECMLCDKSFTTFHKRVALPTC